MNKIEVKNVIKKFDDVELFKGYSLDIKAGEFVIISGPSGCGKTTLLNMIGGLEKTNGGEIHINSKPIKRNKLLYRNDVTYLFQNFLLINEKTVKYNLKIALEYKKLNKKQKNEEINNILTVVGLQDFADKKTAVLSGGQKQRVALARALLMDNDIILADEPTGSLDEENAKMVMDILKSEKDRGKTIVLVSHDKRLFYYADQIIYLTTK